MATDDRQRVITIAHPELYSGELKNRKTGYTSLNAENSRGVTNEFMFAYVHENINILLSVLGILYDFNLNT